MELKPSRSAETDTEQRLYALWLQWGGRLGLGLLVASFLLYVSDLLPLRIPHEQLATYWGLSAREYTAAMGLRPGWDWLGHLGNGDVLPVAAIAFLATVSLGCYAMLAGLYLRRRERLYAQICLAELLVLALAASGRLHGGH